jgi:hypothetical protein
MPKKPKTKPEAKAPEPELPEWMDGTPTMIYSLEAFHNQTWQQIDLTREEYDGLKAHLLKLRGIKVPAEANNA